jgi:HEAT repeat protein
MRMPMLLAVALALVLCPAGRSQNPVAADKQAPRAAKDGTDRLLSLVKEHPSLLVRVAALDMLGQVGSKDPEVVKALKRWLKEPPGKRDVQPFLLPYVVQALGKVGPAAGDVLPDLLEAKGKDSTLDLTIDVAVQAIKKPAAAKTIKDLQPDLKAALNPKQPSSEYVTTLIAILQDASNGPALRVMAAKALGAAGKDAKDAIEPLRNVTTESMVDDDLKAVATAAIRKINEAP